MRPMRIPGDLTEEIPKSETEKDPGTKESLEDFTTDKLKTLLDEALKNEDYERAAKIRDEMNRRN